MRCLLLDPRDARVADLAEAPYPVAGPLAWLLYRCDVPPAIGDTIAGGVLLRLRWADGGEDRYAVAPIDLVPASASPPAPPPPADPPDHAIRHDAEGYLCCRGRRLTPDEVAQVDPSHPTLQTSGQGT